VGEIEFGWGSKQARRNYMCKGKKSVQEQLGAADDSPD